MLYKLTNKHDRTYGDTQWGPGVKHTARRVTGHQRELCTPDLIHAYRDPLLAVAMDPAQGAFGETAHLWIARGKVAVDDGTKVGCVSLTTLEQRDLPTITTDQRVRFAIYAAREVLLMGRVPVWDKWAAKWLDGTDRSYAAADAADAAYAAADAAHAAHTADAADAAYAAAHAAHTADAADAAYAAADAAHAAAAAYVNIDLVRLIHRAVEGET